LAARTQQQDIVVAVSNELIERGYPKKHKQVVTTTTSTKPKKDYYNYATPVSSSYKEHWYVFLFSKSDCNSVIQLANEFPRTAMKDIRAAIDKYNGHYAPARKVSSYMTTPLQSSYNV
jgi:hypothetical protein